MKIVFLGGIFDESNKNYIFSNSIGLIQNAADTLQKGFIKGLVFYYPDMKIVNLPFVGAYPRLFKQPFLRLKKGSVFGVEVSNRSFCNLKGYKLFSRFINMFFGISRLNNALFIIYSINIPFILAAYLKKMVGRNVKIILIIPDLPEFMNSKISFLKRTILDFQNFLLKKILFKKIDGFVLLTKEMNERLGIDKRKITVIEGIFNSSDSSIGNNDKTVNGKFLILYSGTLDIRYGVLDLINQFSEIEDSNLELIICGSGDDLSNQKVVELCKKDNRINFRGQLVREEIIELQKKVSLLVNPRKPEEFTKFSFPSKTMEYFASGTPVLMYNLDGIPKEYYEFCYKIDCLSEECLKNKIEKIKALPQEEREYMGKRAREFVLQNKNEIKQVEKLRVLINTIVS